MNLTSDDLVGLDRAISTIEQMLHHIEHEIDAVPFFGPTDLGELSPPSQAAARRAERTAYRANPELSAAHFCLTAAGALIDISQTLLRCDTRALGPFERVRYMRSMMSRTKTAGRAAYRAALILTDQGEEAPRPAAVPATGATASEALT
jgi:hypothetical protein